LPCLPLALRGSKSICIGRVRCKADTQTICWGHLCGLWGILLIVNRERTVSLRQRLTIYHQLLRFRLLSPIVAPVRSGQLGRFHSKYQASGLRTLAKLVPGQSDGGGTWGKGGGFVLKEPQSGGLRALDSDDSPSKTSDRCCRCRGIFVLASDLLRREGENGKNRRTLPDFRFAFLRSLEAPLLGAVLLYGCSAHSGRKVTKFDTVLCVSSCCQGSTG